MEEVKKFIEEITKDNSSLYKLKVLEKYSKSESVKNLLDLVYNPEYQYYVKYTTVTPITTGNDNSWQDFITLFRLISARVYRRDEIQEALNDYTQDYQNIAEQILNRKITNANISVKTINKVFYKLIPVFGYMRCSNFEKIDNISYPAFSQTKMDGAFVNIIIDKCSVVIRTRQGKRLDINLNHELKIDALAKKSVLMGEVLVTNGKGKLLDRKTSNGLINKLLKKEQVIDRLTTVVLLHPSTKNKNKLVEAEKMYHDIQKRTIFKIWDVVPYEYWASGDKYEVEYKYRLTRVEAILSLLKSDRLSLVNNTIVCSLDEAKQDYLKNREAGEEGTILKNYNSFWKNGTSTEQIKLKAEYVCELKVVGYTMGEGQFKEGIGSLICESSDGLLKVNVSGLSREERGLKIKDATKSAVILERIKEFNLNYYTGKIVSVKFNEVIKDNSGKYSLFLPRLDEIRFDKDVADTKDYIVTMSKVN